MIGVATSTQNGIARRNGRARRGNAVVLCGIALCAVLPSCKRRERGEAPAVRADTARLGDALVVGSGSDTSIDMTGVRGETLRVWGDLQLAGPGLTVQHLVAGPVTVTRGSSAMYGGSTGIGAYPDVLRATGAGLPLSVVTIARDVSAGVYQGTLRALDGRELPATLTIAPVTLVSGDMPAVWAYYDPRELSWAGLGHGTVATPSPEERACIAMFRSYGVLLSPDLPIEAWDRRKELLADARYIPALIKTGDEARAWIDATRNAQPVDQLPFAIPIDEPHDAEARARVRKLAADVRAAGGGPRTFLFAVTDEPHPEYGDLIDLYITLTPKRADTYLRWTYNGAPPRAGSMVVDTLAPGPRTWGLIAYEYGIKLWYVWDALYWHDRHNRKGGPLPGRALDPAHDATSFDNGEDHGNLDGVLAFPGDAATPCLPSVRLAMIHRGLQDHALLAAAVHCDSQAAVAIVRRMIPAALGDVKKTDRPAWPTDEQSWEHARRELIAIASRCPS
jgi:hypothetical protein